MTLNCRYNADSYLVFQKITVNVGNNPTLRNKFPANAEASIRSDVILDIFTLISLHVYICIYRMYVDQFDTSIAIII